MNPWWSYKEFNCQQRLRSRRLPELICLGESPGISTNTNGVQGGLRHFTCSFVLVCTFCAPCAVCKYALFNLPPAGVIIYKDISNSAPATGPNSKNSQLATLQSNNNNTYVCLKRHLLIKHIIYNNEVTTLFVQSH